MKKLLLLLILNAAFGIIANSQTPGSIDETFNSSDTGYGNGDGFNSAIVDVDFQTDGKILVAGPTNYNGVTTDRLIRLNSDWSIDENFDLNLGTGFGSAVTTVLIQSDGKILVGGSFTTVNGVPYNRIVRLNSDGTVDNSFIIGTGFNNSVFAFALQSDGKILVAGNFTSYNGTSKNRIIRLNSDGSIDVTFNPGSGFDNFVKTLAIQSDGKIVAGGDFTSINGTSYWGIARLDDEGNLDNTFNPGIAGNGFHSVNNSIVNDIELQPDGKLIVLTVSHVYQNITINCIVRLNSDATIDNTFNTGTGFDDLSGIESPSSIEIQPDGKLIIVGNFFSFNGQERNRIVRLNSNGSIDNDFIYVSGFDGNASKVKLHSDGHMVIGGSFSAYNDIISARLAYIYSDGSLNTTNQNYGTGFNGSVNCNILQPDGKIIAGGSFTYFNNISNNKIARLNSDGSHDNTFNTGSGFNSSGAVYHLAIASDGKIIAAGSFSDFNGVERNKIARLNSDGSLDVAFDSGNSFNNDIYGIALQPDGKVIVCGNFTSFDGTSRNRIARLNTDGSLDVTFNPGTGFNNDVYSLALQSDGKVIASGSFTSFGGVTRNYIARITTSGGLDNSFTAGSAFNNNVTKVALQIDGKILASGTFTNSGHVRIARLLSDGSLDNTFITGTGFSSLAVSSFAFQDDGKILTAGAFTSFNGNTCYDLARLNSDGSYDAAFSVGSGVDNAVGQIALQPDGKIIVGGTYTVFNGTGRNRICRLYGGDLITSIEDDNEMEGSSYHKIYPNPATNLLTIETENGKGIYQLQDVTGKVLLSGSVTTTKFNLDISALSKGIYLLSLFDGEQQVNRKVVKE